MTVTECGLPATVSVDVVKVALPLAFKLTTVGAPPSMTKLAVPVGVPAPGGPAVTVAVKVTLWPVVDGFCDEVTLVALLSLLTVCATVALLPR